MKTTTLREEDIPLVQQQWTAYLLKAVCRRRVTYLKKVNCISDAEIPLNDEYWRLIHSDQIPGLEEHMPLTVSLQNAIAAMPKRTRLVVQMKTLQGRTLGDIAQQLKIPVNTVKTVFYTAMKKLRGELRD